jgi:2-amino-4-hydroxy-6-hydroxymethyldihydropteridine diphosphokinase
MARVSAYIGLGSNLDGPETQVVAALQALDGIRDSRLVSSSSLYRSPPMGPQDQPDFVNAVARLETTLAALELLEALQAIERDSGRVRVRHWGPRVLDLDLLLYADRIIESPGLTVPHPGIAERSFVLYPLAEIAPQLEIPGLADVKALMKACPAAGLVRIGSAPALPKSENTHGQSRFHRR